jgi:erythromycin esterase
MRLLGATTILPSEVTMLNRRRLLLGGTALAAAAVAPVIPLVPRSHAEGAQAGADVVAWLKANALPLATVEPGNGFRDLEPLRAILGRARVVGLGEATHGTREFFQLKHRLIEFCVAELGFTIIAFESNYGKMLPVNDYVLYGKGNATDVVGAMSYPIYDTEEVVAVVEWVRAWNLAHERKVKVHGLDMQESAAASLHLLAYLDRVAPDFAAASECILAPLASQFTLFASLAQSIREKVFTHIKAVIEAFETERAHWIASASEMEWHLARQSAVALREFARSTSAADNREAFAVRDPAMAETARALLDAEGRGAKALLWAHNGHVKRLAGFDFPNLSLRLDAPSMGNELHRKFGAEYVPVGFAFNQGAFRVQVADGTMDTRVVGPAPDGMVDAVLASAGIPLYALDLTRVPADGPIARWMASKPQQRMIGNEPFELERDPTREHRLDFAADPRDNFDIILFVERTAAARGPARPAPVETVPVPNPEPTNLAFAGGDGIPGGWTAMKDDFYPTDLYPYVMAFADEKSPTGGRVVRIARTDRRLPWGDGALGQSFPAQRWRGRRLVFSAAVRADSSRIGTGAQLMVRVWPKEKGGSSAKPIMALQPDGPVRSPSWTRRSIAVDIPADAERILVGLVVTGPGIGWFGDLELEEATRRMGLD